MTKGTLVARPIEKMKAKEMALKMECTDEPLTPCQEAARKKIKDECSKVKKMLESLVKQHNGTLICQAGAVSAYQYQLPSSAPPAAALVKPNAQTQMISVNQNTAPNNQTIKLNMLNNTATTQGNMQLVIDPRMGVILGTVAPQQGIVTAPVSLMTNITNNTSTTMSTMTTASPVVAPITPVPQQVPNDQLKFQLKATRPVRKSKTPQMPVQQPEIIEETPPPPPPPTIIKRITKPSGTTHVVAPSTSTTPQATSNFRVKTVTKQTVMHRPHETNSIGGLMIGNKMASGEMIDESKKNQPDGKEISFNKMNGGRTYPSLVVVARPNLKIKNVTSQAAQKERSELDIKVKGVLMYQSNKFTEWLLQQGLVRSEHFCDKHPNNSLKLGQYTDAAQNFNYSGGYVWITSCCPDRFVSVFCGSIFQGSPHSPTVLLKLVYHWACQTNVQNVVSWVKVTNYYVKTFYTNLRSICTAAIAEKCKKMGGKNSLIQVGVISLGTTSQDGNLRQVKVEVLGILDPDTMELRLRACEPVNDIDRSYRRRFTNILHPLTEWVHKDSKILTDFTVDKATLQEMGFHNISQTAFGEQNPRSISSNYHIMEYLRKIVPRMFQNTLSLLSRQMIQQFLDELVWREMYGGTALRAFENILTHINEQTQLNSDIPLLERLTKISANPFADWSYKHIPSKMTLPTSPPTAGNSGSSNPVVSGPFQAPMVTIPKDPAIQSAIDLDSVSRPVTNKRANRKRPYAPASPEITVEHTVTPESRLLSDGKTDQVSLYEFYYGTMQPEKPDKAAKENKIVFNFNCFLCSATMHSNTEIMEHMVSHVPPQVPGQSDPPVCRYCCTAFSSQHQMSVHITEAHSNFGKSDSVMLVCAICEQKFGSGGLLINHLSSMHYPSEMPYRCDTCSYRTSSHKDVIDHYYTAHDKSDSVQCPYCLKIVKFVKNGQPQASNVYAYLLHMQRHIVRREEKLNKCPRCCLWFNQMSSLKAHVDLHCQAIGPKVVPYKTSDNPITVARSRNCVKRYVYDDFAHEIMPTDRVKKWYSGPLKIHAPNGCGCQECEEDVDMREHYPGELKCLRCRYVTCCWRAYKEHQRQIHNERPMTSVVVPSPLVNIPLEREMQCTCGYKTTDGNHLATHLVKCKKRTAFPAEETRPGMLDSLGLVPKPVASEEDKDNSKSLLASKTARRTSLSIRGKVRTPHSIADH
ncbi:uncharacterized protein LOC106638490 isoform X2 [Copidosoma floridanum]|uniref:uncharacterized protein LOC106638490 isoform X2 n=1 Tax=Copidosoma floridanum TaxID=29053 RepID=UPI0006C9E393|nr:uncharacterized protein LOC106638490 isoform X2 [Copidosoma floridanum]